MYTTFVDKNSTVCGPDCAMELDTKRALAQGKNANARILRIAELDPVRELDSLIADLASIPSLEIDRYLMPQETYVLFASNPPPLGLDFPIATLEGDWDLEIQTKLDEKSRVYGRYAVENLLLDIQETAFAVTRKMTKGLAARIKAGEI